MKRTLYTFLFLFACASMQAQIIKVSKGETVVAKYSNKQADKVTFEQEASTTTMGTAKATISCTETDIQWVQLWAGGPKFAAYNVGATSENGIGTAMTWADACKTSTDFAWGANWSAATKEQWSALLSNTTHEFVQVNGVWGIRFEGNTDGYLGNSIFVPTSTSDDGNNDAHYWTTTDYTTQTDNAWTLYVAHSATISYVGLDDAVKTSTYLIRPIYTGE